MTDMVQEAKHSVVVVHQLIERIFNNASESEETLNLFLSYFHPSFMLITPAGQRLSLTAMEALFRGLKGQREGVRIATGEYEILSQNGTDVVIQYCELQMRNGETQKRIAVAILDCSTANPRWRFLQETLCA